MILSPSTIRRLADGFYREKIYTMFTIGSSQAKMVEILGFELVIIIAISATVAIIMYYFTGYFVEVVNEVSC